MSEIIMIGTPGLVERSQTQMSADFVGLASGKHIAPDIPTLYPSPTDIAGISDRFKTLTEKRDQRYLSPEEREELAYYELAVKRQAEPDKLLLSNLNEKERDRIGAIDDELQLFLRVDSPQAKKQIEKLMAERTKMLIPKARELVDGKVEGESLQQGAKIKPIARHAMRSVGELSGTLKDLSSDITTDAVQSVIDANNALEGHTLDITLIAGDNDPITGDYDLGEVNRIHVGQNTTINEIRMHSFDHFTLPDDPVRTAQVVKRIIERNRTASH